MDTSRFIAYAELYLQRQRLKDQVKKIEATMEAMRPGLIETMAMESTLKLSINTSDGPRTCYTKRTLWAGPTNGDYAKACAALKASGDQVLADMVHERFNAMTISAWVRERFRDELGLPPIFHERYLLKDGPIGDPSSPLVVTDKYDLGVVKS